MIFLEVFGAKARLLRDAREHARPELFAIREGEDHVRPIRPRERLVRARLTRDRPSDAREGSKDLARLRRWPLTHTVATGYVALKLTDTRSGPASPCSSRSARTRNASASTRTVASSRDAP